MNPVGKSDHGVLMFHYLCNGQETPPTVKPNYYTPSSCSSHQGYIFEHSECRCSLHVMKVYYQGNYNAMRDYLKDISWSKDGDDLEMQWGNMKDTLLEVTDKFIPKRFPNKKKKNKIWSNRTVIQAVKMKHVLGTDIGKQGVQTVGKPIVKPGILLHPRQRKLKLNMRGKLLGRF